jgi:hypothetical protein
LLGTRNASWTALANSGGAVWPDPIAFDVLFLEEARKSLTPQHPECTYPSEVIPTELRQFFFPGQDLIMHRIVATGLVAFSIGCTDVPTEPKAVQASSQNPLTPENVSSNGSSDLEAALAHLDQYLLQAPDGDVASFDSQVRLLRAFVDAGDVKQSEAALKKALDALNAIKAGEDVNTPLVQDAARLTILRAQQ